MAILFKNRVDAGTQLGEEVAHRDTVGPDPVVLGLPRGGVVVARRVAERLDAPLDVIIVRKLGVPWQPELAMGAIGEDGSRFINDKVTEAIGIGETEVAAAEERERIQVERRARLYRGSQPRIPIEGRNVLIVDDGIATGSTAQAACRVARMRGAGRITLATPVAARQSVQQLQRETDEVICPHTPAAFYAIGQFYADFSQTSDEEVIELLARSSGRAERHADEPVAERDEDVEIFLGPLRLQGHLSVPIHPAGLVLFAHGSGSSRLSPRNRFVAEALNGGGLGTLLFDLLTPDEERNRANVFDIRLLGDRLVAVTEWIRVQPGLGGLAIGYFGASTGAAAALWAATRMDDVAAVVSRGGRPDLAPSALPTVSAPTLLIVGGRDPTVEELNREAQRQLTCEKRIVIVPGATHLFEEPGTLDRVADLARVWFQDHMKPTPALEEAG